MPSNRGFFAGRHPRVIGHRGTAGTAPENTMISFELAAAIGVDVLETDIHLTKDKRVVVCHDETVDRTTNGTGRIEDMTLAEVQQLDAGYNFCVDGEYPYRGMGVIIPEFEELLKDFLDFPLNVETKPDDAELRDIYFELLRKYGRLDDGSIVAAGDKHSMLNKIRGVMQFTSCSKLECKSIVFMSMLGLRPIIGKKATALQVPIRRGPIPVVTPRTVRAAHKLGLEVHVWTINDVDEMRRLLLMGVDGIFTDFPLLLRQLVDAEF
ncbi:glycerophosphodiester phosphodiesterase [soil metagenome]